MDFAQQIRRPWARMALFSACLLGLYACGVSGAPAAGLAVISWVILDRCAAKLASIDLRRYSLLVIGSVLQAVLFLLVLPVGQVLGQQVIYQQFALLTRKVFVLKPVAWFEDPLIVGYFFLLAFSVVFLVEYGLLRVAQKQKKGFVETTIGLIIFALSLFGWRAVGIEGVLLVLLGGLSLVVIEVCRARLIRMDFSREKHLVMGPAILALFFMIMLPVGKLFAQSQTTQPPVPTPNGNLAFEPALLGETLLSIIFFYILVFSVIFLVWGWLRRAAILPVSSQKIGVSPFFQVFGYALPMLINGGVFLYAYWPGILSPDSFSQWKQLDDLKTLFDWHPVTLTLLEFLLTRLWYNPAVIAIFQILVLALFWGLMMRYFAQKGLNRWALFGLSMFFAFLPYNQILPVTLWKDVLYATVNMLLVFMLGQIWLSRGEWLASKGHLFFLGTVLAFAFLLRHNGLVVLALTPPALLLLYPRRWRGIALSAVIAALLVLGIRNGIAFGLLKARPNYESVAYVVPIQHISAAAHAGVTFTPQDVAVLEHIAPLDIWRNSYDPIYADSLTKPWGALRDEEVDQKISAVKGDLLRIFIQTALQHPGIVLRSEVNLMISTWQISSMLKETHALHLEYFPVSTDMPADMQNPALFVHPNLHSGIKIFLDQYLKVTDVDPVLFPLIWQGGIYLFLSLLFGLAGIALRGRGFWILLVPTLANLASLVVSMPVQNFRYVYPIVLSVFPLILFAFFCLPPQQASETTLRDMPLDV